MKTLFVNESATGEVVTLHFINENSHCERIATLVCDAEQKKIIALGASDENGWEGDSSVFDFYSSPIRLHFGIRNGKYGLYIFFDSPPEDQISDPEKVFELWREGWIGEISQYDIQLCSMPNAEINAELTNFIWIGDDTYYAPRN